MVVDDTLSMRIYSFIDNILINKTIKQIKQKIDFTVFCVRHLGLIVTAVTINGFTPVDKPIFVNTKIFMPPLKKEGHIALHMLVGMSVYRNPLILCN